MTAPGRFVCEMPQGLRTRPRDARGFPVPYVVWIDAKGKPHFEINDEDRRRSCATRRLCGLCGKRVEGPVWFVGGPRCFTHPQGAFIDPPMHHACAHFALQVCPYLAVRSYRRRLDGKLVKEGDVPEGTVMVMDSAMTDDRPALFTAGGTDSFIMVGEARYFKAGPWLALEQWQHGIQLEDAVRGAPV